MSFHFDVMLFLIIGLNSYYLKFYFTKLSLEDLFWNGIRLREGTIDILRFDLAIGTKNNTINLIILMMFNNTSQLSLNIRLGLTMKSSIK